MQSSKVALNTPAVSFTKITSENFENICRTCIINRGEVDILKTHFQKLSICEVIHLCTKEKISPGDGLSNKICNGCLKLIVNFFTFVNRLKDNQRHIHKLYNIFKETSNIDDSEAINVNNEIFRNIDQVHKNKFEIEYFEKSAIPKSDLLTWSVLELKTEKAILQPGNKSPELEKSNRIFPPKEECRTESGEWKAERSQCDNLISINSIHGNGLNNYEENDLAVDNEVSFSDDDDDDDFVLSDLIKRNKERSMITRKRKSNTRSSNTNSKRNFLDKSIKSSLAKKLRNSKNIGKELVNATPESTKHPEEIIITLETDTTEKDGSRLDQDNSDLVPVKDDSDVKKIDLDNQCFECLEIFETMQKLTFHSKETGHTIPPRFKCPLCPKPFKTSKALKSHLNHHAEKNRNSVCDICGATVLERNLKRHLHTHDNGKSYACKYCSKSFSQPGTLADHVGNKHEGRVKTCLCSICGRVCNNTTQLTTHLNTHTQAELKDIASRCDECGKFLISDESLSRHIQRYHGEPRKKKPKKKPQKRTKKYSYAPRQCPLCFKFISYIGYSTHMKMHQGLKPFECDVCFQTFKQQSHLKSHKNIHLDLKPFKCEFCEKTFRHRTSLRTHERAHKGERPFVCYVCKKAFYESSPMKKHLKTHSKEELRNAEAALEKANEKPDEIVKNVEEISQ